MIVHMISGITSVTIVLFIVDCAILRVYNIVLARFVPHLPFDIFTIHSFILVRISFLAQ